MTDRFAAACPIGMAFAMAAAAPALTVGSAVATSLDSSVWAAGATSGATFPALTSSIAPESAAGLGPGGVMACWYELLGSSPGLAAVVFSSESDMAGLS